MSNNEIDLEIGFINKQIVLHIKYKNTDKESVLIGLKRSELSSFIETLQQAQKQIEASSDEYNTAKLTIT